MVSFNRYNFVEERNIKKQNVRRQLQRTGGLVADHVPREKKILVCQLLAFLQSIDIAIAAAKGKGTSYDVCDVM